MPTHIFPVNKPGYEDEYEKHVNMLVSRFSRKQLLYFLDVAGLPNPKGRTTKVECAQALLRKRGWVSVADVTRQHKLWKEQTSSGPSMPLTG